MRVSLRPLGEQVVVITGASSGIGLATARQAARQCAGVVLTSRNDDALATIARELNSARSNIMHVAGDVCRRSDLEHVAEAAIDRFGRIDAWVNNAGLSIWGRLDQVSEEDHRRLFDVNFWGVVNGSLVAAEALERNGGAIINLGSVVSDVAIPVQGMYSASKHAVKGFTDALRIELAEQGTPISVTLVKPGSIDTPFPQHAKNYTSREATLPPPVYSPEEVARVILHAASHPTREVFVGGGAKVMSGIEHVAPRVMDWIGKKFLSRAQLGKKSANGAGTLYEPGDGGQLHGHHEGHVAHSSVYTRAALHPLATGAIVAAGAAAVLLTSDRIRREIGLTRD